MEGAWDAAGRAGLCPYSSNAAQATSPEGPGFHLRDNTSQCPLIGGCRTSLLYRSLVAEGGGCSHFTDANTAQRGQKAPREVVVEPRLKARVSPSPPTLPRSLWSLSEGGAFPPDHLYDSSGWILGWGVGIGPHRPTHCHGGFNFQSCNSIQL